MANTSIELVGLDFDQIKTNLKDYLKRSDSPFKDVDFDGSNISNLIDVLAYNTYLNSFYLNMVASEMFLDTAQLRDSVISHAKELNYIPRSYRSASADISFTVTPSTDINTLIVPKGTSFTTRIGSNTFTFTTSDVLAVTANTDGKFYVDTTIYEGSYFADTFVYSPSNTTQRFVISNPTVDTRSISVQVIENGGANVYTYSQASTFLGVSSNSQVYFLQAAENDQYELIFGDDVIGRKPKAGAAIYVEYRVCNGELPNGARIFDIDGPISGQSNVSTITAVTSATGGDVNEPVRTIKYNATRHYQNQERAVTTDDYETLLLANFSDINAVSAFGGENMDPPVYGKVYIAVDIKSGDAASQSAKLNYYNFIKTRSPISIDPVFIDAEYLYCEVYATVRYNINVTTLKQSDINSLTIGTVSDYNTAYLNGFKKTIRHSKLTELINSMHSSIVSCDLSISPFKLLQPITGTVFKAVIEFGFPLETYYTISYDDAVKTKIPGIRSTVVIKDGKSCYIKDDGNGVLGLYTADGVAVETLLNIIGTVDYASGKVVISNLVIDDYLPASGSHIHLYANPLEKDITSVKNQILTIRDSDIEVAVQALKL